MADTLSDPILRDRPWTRRRQLAGLGLVVAGIAGVVVCAFAVLPLLGFAAVSVGAVAIGVFLGRD